MALGEGLVLWYLCPFSLKKLARSTKATTCNCMYFTRNVSIYIHIYNTVHVRCATSYVDHCLKYFQFRDPVGKEGRGNI